MFWITRATEDLASYMKEVVPVSSDSVNGAVKWLWGLSRTDPVANTSTCEAVLKAVSDPNVSIGSILIKCYPFFFFFYEIIIRVVSGLPDKVDIFCEQ